MSSPPITPEQLAALPPEFRALLQAVIDHYEKRVAELEQKVANLESQLKKSPRNSSLPLSTEHPHAKPTPQKEKSGKKQGGRPGHPQHERSLIPTEQCQKVVSLKPAACRRCGGPLAGNDIEPPRHQVWEIPEIKPQITDYQRHRLNCPCCGISTCEELPAGVPYSQAGSRLVALTALLLGWQVPSARGHEYP